MKHTKQSIISKDGISYLIPFILITSCFALWGFANDITNPMVKAFSKIFRMSATDGALVQVAFYGGYFAMAFPAAIFIRKYSYKAGVLLGLGMYAFGAFLFFPAKMTGEYYPFLIAYFILTCGLSFLETSCNPYTLSMGTEETATRRLNLITGFRCFHILLFFRIIYLWCNAASDNFPQFTKIGNFSFSHCLRQNVSHCSGFHRTCINRNTEFVSCQLVE